MKPSYRILLALGILVVDGVIFFIPLAGIFLAYIVLTNPDWFREFLSKLK